MTAAAHLLRPPDVVGPVNQDLWFHQRDQSRGLADRRVLRQLRGVDLWRDSGGSGGSVAAAAAVGSSDRWRPRAGVTTDNGGGGGGGSRNVLRSPFRTGSSRRRLS